ncbi:BTB/POZ domain-containing protein 3-like [Teleopsis dalmanni]|uniref:BTB/POZ domain-containing protein 3-like n=1 Tax=Teleopsis dalmanni TaxID=139649 RepID=UPI0018CCA06A|nr:BTB/POZ domain-containing protein 3-like [Teleopsis dalmanni]
MSINKDKNWSELSNVERYMFLENTPTDCTFIVGIAKDEIKRIQCHKKVLAECSEVFNSMFNGNYLESEENCEIRLNDVQPYVFEYFLNFVYWDDLPYESSVIELIQLDYLVRWMKDILPSSIYNLNLSSFVVVTKRLSEVLDKLKLFEMFEKYVLINFMQKKKILKM